MLLYVEVSIFSDNGIAPTNAQAITRNKDNRYLTRLGSQYR